MAEIVNLFQIVSTPGIRRDGTLLDSDHFGDGQWVRFQRGRPKKMGGFREISGELTGPVRATQMWSRGLIHSLYSFSSSRVEILQVDRNGVGNSIYDITPAGHVDNPEVMWSVDNMYDDAVGSKSTIIVAVPTRSLSNIDDPTANQVYYGVAGTTNQMVPIPGLTCSGGIVCIAPYLVYYGSDGLVGWSDVNQPQTLNSGDAGTARVTGAKVVKALPMKTSSGPGAILLSLDSVILMQYVGGNAIFRFTTVSSQSSVLSPNSMVEYDGKYYWIGVDRFLGCAGGQVMELPNSENINWFFDNLNWAHSQKVWAMKVPRYGEIWWFYPRGSATECTHAIIYNVRENCWYDCELARGSGYYSQVFRFPMMVSSTARGGVIRAQITASSGSFQSSDSLMGVTSGATFTVLKVETNNYYQLSVQQGGVSPVLGEGISNLSRPGSGTLILTKGLYSAFSHEWGFDAVYPDRTVAIPSFIETSDFGLPTGGTNVGQDRGANRNTRIIRVEPDFLQSGRMTFTVRGRKHPADHDVISEEFEFLPETSVVDLREQRRLIRLRFESNCRGGNYEMGRTILHLEPGDPAP